MRLLDKLLKRNQVKEQVVGQIKEQEYAKEDIHIYAEMLDEPILRNDKSYVIAGYYNEDNTKFKDLISGKVFECKKHNFEIMSIEDKKYAELRRVTNLLPISGYTHALRILAMTKFNYGCMRYVVDNVVVEGRDIIVKYFNKQHYEPVTSSELKFIAKEFNQHIYEAVSQTLSNNKQLEDLRSSQYTKFQ